MKIFRFLASPSFWANFGLAILFTFLAFQLVQWGLKAYTRHNKAIEVPKLQGLIWEEGVQVLDDLGLDLEILDSSDYNPAFPGHGIYSQYPIPGAKVKRGRAIKVSINPLQEPPAILPDLKEKPKKRAEIELINRGFALNEIKYTPYLGKDVVVRVEYQGKPIKPGTPLPRGSKITLVLGEGLGTVLESVPNLLGMRLSEVERQLPEWGFSLGARIFDSKTDTSNALVYRQYPPPGLDPGAFRGSDIDLWLSSDSTKVKKAALSDSTQTEEFIDF